MDLLKPRIVTHCILGLRFYIDICFKSRIESLKADEIKTLDL